MQTSLVLDTLHWVDKYGENFKARDEEGLNPYTHTPVDSSFCESSLVGWDVFVLFVRHLQLNSLSDSHGVKISTRKMSCWQRNT